MSEHGFQNLLVERYGKWADACQWIYPAFLRWWLLSFAPVRGECVIYHGEHTTHAESESDSGDYLMFACGHCPMGIEWRPGLICVVENRHELRDQS